MRKYVWILLVGLIACDGVVRSKEPIHLDWRVALEGESVSTPLVTADYIALGTSEGLTIVERDGSSRCVFEQAGSVIAAPKTDGRSIFFGSTNYMAYAIDPQCKEVWSRSTRDRIKSDPLVHNSVVYFTSYDGHIYALNATSGKEIWTFPRSVATPEQDEDKFEVDASGEAAVAARETPTLGLAGAAIGMPVAEADTEAESDAEAESDTEAEPDADAEPAVITGSFSYSSPTIFNNTLYVGNLDHRLYAIDIETGKMKWRYKTDAPVTSSPRVHKGVLYFGSNDGNVYAVDTDPLGVLWRSKTNHWVNSSPLIDGKTLYIGGNDKNLYAFNLKSGRADWRHRTPGPVISIPASYKNLVVFAGGKGDGRIYGVDKRHGKLFWSYKTGGKIESDPVIDGNKLFVSSGDGYLYAFSILKTRAR